jgi:SAM-dependent methyltransferase
MKLNSSILLLSLGISSCTGAFVPAKSNNIINKNQASFADRQHSSSSTTTKASNAITDITEDSLAEDISSLVSSTDEEAKRQLAKKQLFGLIGTKPLRETAGYADPILADPTTKEALKISTAGTLVGGQSSSRTSMKVLLKSSDSTFQGRSSTYFDLLSDSSLENKVKEEEREREREREGGSDSSSRRLPDALNSLLVFVPPPLRGAFSTTDNDYIPMRDLFTSPQVSFAYERGWRQGFAAAGFPGADKEYELVKEYFMPVNPDVVVDMSCATGLFTRRLAKGGDYKRVIGCDYSDSMLSEARRRIEADGDLKNGNSFTKIDLIRCDVGNIPMQTESVPALHAGAAMHCWPDLDAALSEIHRVLKPGGRYFASTFLAEYFRNVKVASGDTVNTQAFQYFESKDMLRDLLLKAGFENDKIDIEVLGTSCCIIRAEK